MDYCLMVEFVLGCFSVAIVFIENSNFIQVVLLYLNAFNISLMSDYKQKSLRIILFVSRRQISCQTKDFLRSHIFQDFSRFSLYNYKIFAKC